MDATDFNRRAWDNIARSRHRWFTPAPKEQIVQAKAGEYSIRLTACKQIPQDWLGDLSGQRILALAAGGGHQGPILAAAGASVTVVDISDGQLDIDRRMADEHRLDLKTLRSDMADLRDLDDASFDMIINPCSVNFIPNVRPVWQEAARVLRDGGVMIAGLIQPVNYLFDETGRDDRKLKVRFQIPYSDLDLPEEERERTIGPERPIDFGHSLTDLIGGQLDAGFQLTAIMEDTWGGDDVLSEHIATFLATRSIRMSR